MRDSVPRNAAVSVPLAKVVSLAWGRDQAPPQVRLDELRPTGHRPSDSQPHIDDVPTSATELWPETGDVLSEQRFQQFLGMYATDITIGTLSDRIARIAREEGVDPATFGDPSRWSEVSDELRRALERRELFLRRSAELHSLASEAKRALLDFFRYRSEIAGRRDHAAAEYRRLSGLLDAKLAEHLPGQVYVHPHDIEKYCAAAALMDIRDITGNPDIRLLHRDVSPTGTPLFEVAAASGAHPVAYENHSQLAEQLLGSGDGATALVFDHYEDGGAHSYVMTSNGNEVAVSDWNGSKLHSFPRQSLRQVKVVYGFLFGPRLEESIGRPLEPMDEITRRELIELSNKYTWLVQEQDGLKRLRQTLGSIDVDHPNRALDLAEVERRLRRIPGDKLQIAYIANAKIAGRQLVAVHPDHVGIIPDASLDNVNLTTVSFRKFLPTSDLLPNLLRIMKPGGTATIRVEEPMFRLDTRPREVARHLANAGFTGVAFHHNGTPFTLSAIPTETDGDYEIRVVKPAAAVDRKPRSSIGARPPDEQYNRSAGPDDIPDGMRIHPMPGRPGVTIELISFDDGSRILRETYDNTDEAVAEWTNTWIGRYMGAPIAEVLWQEPQYHVLYREHRSLHRGTADPRVADMLGLFYAITGQASPLAAVFVRRVGRRRQWQDHHLRRQDIIDVGRRVREFWDYLFQTPYPEAVRWTMRETHMNATIALGEIAAHAEHPQLMAGLDLETQAKVRLVETFKSRHPYLEVTGFDSPYISEQVAEVILGRLDELLDRYRYAPGYQKLRTNIRALRIDLLSPQTRGLMSPRYDERTDTVSGADLTFNLLIAAEQDAEKTYAYVAAHEFAHAIDQATGFELSQHIPAVLREAHTKLERLGLDESYEEWLGPLPLAHPVPGKEAEAAEETMAIGFAHAEINFDDPVVGSANWVIHEYVTKLRQPDIGPEFRIDPRLRITGPTGGIGNRPPQDPHEGPEEQSPAASRLTESPEMSAAEALHARLAEEVRYRAGLQGLRASVAGETRPSDMQQLRDASVRGLSELLGREILQDVARRVSDPDYDAEFSREREVVQAEIIRLIEQEPEGYRRVERVLEPLLRRLRALDHDEWRELGRRMEAGAFRWLGGWILRGILLQHPMRQDLPEVVARLDLSQAAQHGDLLAMIGTAAADPVTAVASGGDELAEWRLLGERAGTGSPVRELVAAVSAYLDHGRITDLTHELLSANRAVHAAYRRDQQRRLGNMSSETQNIQAETGQIVTESAAAPEEIRDLLDELARVEKLRDQWAESWVSLRDLGTRRERATGLPSIRAEFERLTAALRWEIMRQGTHFAEADPNPGRVERVIAELAGRASSGATDEGMLERLENAKRWRRLYFLLRYADRYEQLLTEVDTRLGEIRRVRDQLTTDWAPDSWQPVPGWVPAGAPREFTPLPQAAARARDWGRRIAAAAERKRRFSADTLARASRLGIDDAETLSPRELAEVVDDRAAGYDDLSRALGELSHASSALAEVQAEAFEIENGSVDLESRMVLDDFARVAERSLRLEAATDLAEEVIRSEVIDRGGRRLAPGVGVLEIDGTAPKILVAGPVSRVEHLLERIDSADFENLIRRGVQLVGFHVVVDEQGRVFVHEVVPEPAATPASGPEPTGDEHSRRPAHETFAERLEVWRTERRLGTRVSATARDEHAWRSAHDAITDRLDSWLSAGGIGTRLTPCVAFLPDSSGGGGVVVVAAPLGGHDVALAELATANPRFAGVGERPEFDCRYLAVLPGIEGPIVAEISAAVARNPDGAALPPGVAASHRAASAVETEGILLGEYLRYRRLGLVRVGFRDWLAQLGEMCFGDEGLKRDGTVQAFAAAAAEAQPTVDEDRPDPTAVLIRVAGRSFPLPDLSGPPSGTAVGSVSLVGTVDIGGVTAEVELFDDGGVWRVAPPRGDGQPGDVLSRWFEGRSDTDPDRLLDRLAHLLNDGEAALTTVDAGVAAAEVDSRSRTPHVWRLRGFAIGSPVEISLTRDRRGWRSTVTSGPNSEILNLTGAKSLNRMAQELTAMLRISNNESEAGGSRPSQITLSPDEIREYHELVRQADAAAGRSRACAEELDTLAGRLGMASPEVLEMADPAARTAVLASLRGAVARDRAALAAEIGVDPSELESIPIIDAEHDLWRNRIEAREADIDTLARLLAHREQLAAAVSRARRDRDAALTRPVVAAELERSDRSRQLGPGIVFHPNLAGRHGLLVVIAPPNGHAAALTALALEHREFADASYRLGLRIHYLRVDPQPDGRIAIEQIEPQAAGVPIDRRNEARLHLLHQYLVFRKAGVLTAGFREWLRQLGAGAFTKWPESARVGKGLARSTAVVSEPLVAPLELIEMGRRTVRADPALDPRHPAHVLHRLHTHRAAPLPLGERHRGDPSAQTDLNPSAHLETHPISLDVMADYVVLERRGRTWHVATDTSQAFSDLLAVHFPDLTGKTPRELIEQLENLVRAPPRVYDSAPSGLPKTGLLTAFDSARLGPGTPRITVPEDRAAEVPRRGVTGTEAARWAGANWHRGGYSDAAELVEQVRRSRGTVVGVVDLGTAAPAFTVRMDGDVITVEEQIFRLGPRGAAVPDVRTVRGDEAVDAWAAHLMRVSGPEATFHGLAWKSDGTPENPLLPGRKPSGVPGREIPLRLIGGRRDLPEEIGHRPPEEPAVGARRDDPIVEYNTRRMQAVRRYDNDYGLTPLVDADGRTLPPEGIFASVDAEGVLRMQVRASERTPRVFAMVAQMEAEIGHLVTGIQDFWTVTYDGLTTNIDVFNTLLRENPELSPEDAAARTFTGRMAARRGLTRVRFEHLDGHRGDYRHVVVTFTAPDADDRRTVADQPDYSAIAATIHGRDLPGDSSTPVETTLGGALDTERPPPGSIAAVIAGTDHGMHRIDARPTDDEQAPADAHGDDDASPPGLIGHRPPDDAESRPDTVGANLAWVRDMAVADLARRREADAAPAPVDLARPVAGVPDPMADRIRNIDALMSALRLARSERRRAAARLEQAVAACPDLEEIPARPGSNEVRRASGLRDEARARLAEIFRTAPDGPSGEAADQLRRLDAVVDATYQFDYDERRLVALTELVAHLDRWARRVLAADPPAAERHNALPGGQRVDSDTLDDLLRGAVRRLAFDSALPGEELDRIRRAADRRAQTQRDLLPALLGRSRVDAADLLRHGSPTHDDWAAELAEAGRSLGRIADIPADHFESPDRVQMTLEDLADRYRRDGWPEEAKRAFRRLRRAHRVTATVAEIRRMEERARRIDALDAAFRDVAAWQERARVRGHAAVDLERAYHRLSAVGQRLDALARELAAAQPSVRRNRYQRLADKYGLRLWRLRPGWDDQRKLDTELGLARYRLRSTFAVDRTTMPGDELVQLIRRAVEPPGQSGREWTPAQPEATDQQVKSADVQKLEDLHDLSDYAEAAERERTLFAELDYCLANVARELVFARSGLGDFRDTERRATLGRDLAGLRSDAVATADVAAWNLAKIGVPSVSDSVWQLRPGSPGEAQVLAEHDEIRDYLAAAWGMAANSVTAEEADNRSATATSDEEYFALERFRTLDAMLDNARRFHRYDTWIRAIDALAKALDDARWREVVEATQVGERRGENRSWLHALEARRRELDTLAGQRAARPPGRRDDVDARLDELLGEVAAEITVRSIRLSDSGEHSGDGPQYPIGTGLVPEPPDPVTLAHARRDLDRQFRERFGDREPTPIELEDFSMEPLSRLQQYAHVDWNIDKLAVSLGMPSAQLREHMRGELRAAVSGKSVAIRIDAEKLLSVLHDGVYRSNRSPGGERAAFEQLWFGGEPTYGYVAVDGVRPAGLPGLDVLSTGYGGEQIFLKPRVREYTTFTVGDHEVHKTRVIASPLTDPLEWSFGAASDAAHDNPGLVGINRNYAGQPFRGSIYVEAQIHRDITVDDIEFVVLQQDPSAQLRSALEHRGIDWRVLNNRTIAEHGSDSERATAIGRLEEDLARLRTSRRYTSPDPSIRQLNADMEHRLRTDLALLRRSVGTDDPLDGPEYPIGARPPDDEATSMAGRARDTRLPRPRPGDRPQDWLREIRRHLGLSAGQMDDLIGATDGTWAAAEAPVDPRPLTDDQVRALLRRTPGARTLYATVAERFYPGLHSRPDIVGRSLRGIRETADVRIERFALQLGALEVTVRHRELAQHLPPSRGAWEAHLRALAACLSEQVDDGTPLGAVLEIFRRQFGLTREQIAETMSVPTEMIDEIETMVSVPSRSTVEAYLLALLPAVPRYPEGFDTLRHYLKHLRQTAGFSQSELAEEARMLTVAMVRNVESGRTPPSKEIIELYLRVFSPGAVTYQDLTETFHEVPSDIGARPPDHRDEMPDAVDGARGSDTSTRHEFLPDEPVAGWRVDTAELIDTYVGDTPPSYEQLRMRLRELAGRYPDEVAFFREIGSSSEGRPIELLSLYGGPNNIELVVDPHPMEPVGRATALAAAEFFCSRPELWSLYSLHIVVSADPDSAVLNRPPARAVGPVDLSAYYTGMHRSLSTPDWAVPATIPVPERKFSSAVPLPETLTLMTISKAIKPFFRWVGHNADFGGAYIFFGISGDRYVRALSKRIPRLFAEIATRHGIPISPHPIDIALNPDSAEKLGPGVFTEMNLPVGANTGRFAAWFGALSTNIEVPEWSVRPSSVTRSEAIELLKQRAAVFESLVPRVPADIIASEFGRAAAKMIRFLPGEADALQRNPDKLFEPGIVHRPPLRRLGGLLRRIDAALAANPGRAELLALREDVSRYFLEWIEFQRADQDPVWLPLRSTAGMQLELIFSLIPMARATHSDAHVTGEMSTPWSRLKNEPIGDRPIDTGPAGEPAGSQRYSPIDTRRDEPKPGLRRSEPLSTPWALVYQSAPAAQPSDEDGVVDSMWTADGARLIDEYVGDTSPTYEELRRRLRDLAERHPEDVARFSEIGRTREGRPMELLSIYGGPRNILLIVDPHPMESVGRATALALAQYVLTEPGLRSEVSYHFIVCSDPDTAVLNAPPARTVGPVDLAAYYTGIARPIRHPEWSFPAAVPVPGSRWDSEVPLPETLAQMAMIKALRPLLMSRSLHNIDSEGGHLYFGISGGGWVRELGPQIPELFADIAARHAIPVQAIPGDVTARPSWYQHIGNGVYANRWVPGHAFSGTFVGYYGGLPMTIEVPEWITRPSVLTRSQAADLFEQRAAILSELVDRLPSEMPASVFGLAVEAFITSLYEKSEQLRRDPSAKFVPQAVHRWPLRGIAALLRHIDEALVSDHENSELEAIRADVNTNFLEWIQFQRDDQNPVWRPLRSTAGMQLEFILATIPRALQVADRAEWRDRMVVPSDDRELDDASGTAPPTEGAALPGLTIEAATAADVEDLSQRFGKPWILEDRLQRQGRGDGVLFVARRDGSPVAHGYLWLEDAEEPEIRSGLPGVALINHLEVADGLQGRSIGSELIAHMERYARVEAGRDRIALAVLPGNTAAARLYERLGYADWGRGTVQCYDIMERADGSRVRVPDPEQARVLVKDLGLRPLSDDSRSPPSLPAFTTTGGEPQRGGPDTDGVGAEAVLGRHAMDSTPDQVKELLRHSRVGRRVLASLESMPVRERFELMGEGGHYGGVWVGSALTATVFTSGHDYAAQALNLAHEIVHAEFFVEARTVRDPLSMSIDEYVGAMVAEETACFRIMAELAAELRSLGLDIPPQVTEAGYDEAYDKATRRRASAVPNPEQRHQQAHESALKASEQEVATFEWADGRSYRQFYRDAYRALERGARTRPPAGTAATVGHPRRYDPTPEGAERLRRAALRHDHDVVSANELSRRLAETAAELGVAGGPRSITRARVEKEIAALKTELATGAPDRLPALRRRQHRWRELSDMADEYGRLDASIHRMKAMEDILAADVVDRMTSTVPGAQRISDRAVLTPGTPRRLVIVGGPGEHQSVLADPRVVAARRGAQVEYCHVQMQPGGEPHVWTMTAPTAVPRSAPPRFLHLADQATRHRMARIRTELGTTEVGRWALEVLHDVEIVQTTNPAEAGYKPVRHRLVLDAGMSDEHHMAHLVHQAIHVEVARSRESIETVRAQLTLPREAYIDARIDEETRAHAMEIVAAVQLRAAGYDVPEPMGMTAYTEAYYQARSDLAENMAPDGQAVPDRLLPVLDRMANDAGLAALRPEVEAHPESYPDSYGKAWDDAQGVQPFAEQVQAARRSGERSVRALDGGADVIGVQNVELVSYNDGAVYVRVAVRDSRSRHAAVLSSRLGRAFDVPMPRVVAEGDVLYFEPTSWALPVELSRVGVGAPGLGLHDAVAGFPDSADRVMVERSDRVAWSNHYRAFGFEDAAGETPSRFAQRFLRARADGTLEFIAHDVPRSELDRFRDRAERLRPEFERLGRADWHDVVMARLAKIVAHAPLDTVSGQESTARSEAPDNALDAAHPSQRVLRGQPRDAAEPVVTEGVREPSTPWSSVTPATDVPVGRPSPHSEPGSTLATN
ncbi:GNAT family N-acetyltransferase [Nocardia wallacei]|uniref:GNAT family N-acetyltransferase n=1 Tax=Nocardia wallacei TaxID=480035 RepID=UPI00245815E9|nr:GNAT family N-acetyltransferase [Nocardia wallacei]